MELLEQTLSTIESALLRSLSRQKMQLDIDILINNSINDMLSGAHIRIGRSLLVINLGCYIAVNSDSALELLQHRRMQVSTETAKFSAC